MKISIPILNYITYILYLYKVTSLSARSTTQSRNEAQETITPIHITFPRFAHPRRNERRIDHAQGKIHSPPENVIIRKVVRIP